MLMVAAVANWRNRVRRQNGGMQIPALVSTQWHQRMNDLTQSYPLDYSESHIWGGDFPGSCDAAHSPGRKCPSGVPVIVVGVPDLDDRQERDDIPMKYLMLVCFDPSQQAAAERQPDPPADDSDGDSFPWLDEMTARGIRLDGDRLSPPAEGRTVRVRNGEVLLADGPFAETKEVIVGYDVIECADLDEAVAVAAAHPVAQLGAIEVRPFWR
jgi:hypothetical protein